MPKQTTDFARFEKIKSPDGEGKNPLGGSLFRGGGAFSRNLFLCWHVPAPHSRNIALIILSDW